MSFLKKNKNIVLFIIIAAIAVGGYFFFFNPQDKKSEKDIVSETANNQLAPSSASKDGKETGSEILSMLLQIRSVNLDSSVFERETFKSLEDFGVELKSRPKGRINPFEPISDSSDTN